ncbi:MAG: tetratricopeptide repeat protein [Armatimonadetes bacterium]|nr:tetratricopeptide repeat protein [Armatimonadota bacterium]
MTRCPRCGKDNPPEAQFCMACGAPLFQPCPRCGAANPLDAHFCLRCGAPLAEAAQVERRVLSVLFADLVGSTPLASRLDPETTRTIIGDYFAAMREEVERHGGVVEKFIGDAVMSAFGLPTAHEDDPERAVRAAVAMQARMPALNAHLGADLHIRIGITTGEVVADPRAVAAGEFMVTGDVVNLAARLQETAPPDGIVVDERTYTSTRLAVRYRELPPSDGDFAGRGRWQVVALAEEAPAMRLRAPMIGREDELQFLLALYRRVVEGRKHHLVTIVGAAGVGKSRLVEEWLDRLRGGTDGAHVMRGRCPAYGEGLTYRPLAEMLRAECGIKDNDPAPVVEEKLQAGIRAVCEPVLGAAETEAIIADLASVVGIKVPARRSGLDLRAAGDALVRSLRAYLVARGRSRPVVVVIEDLHWAEESLLELLKHLAVRGADAPILIVCLARPELLERHPDWAAGVRNYTVVSLSPLPASLSDRLMAELLKGEGVPAEVRAAVLAKAEGNPLFIQEILRMLIDSGGLVRDERGWRRSASPVEIRIPDTIHGILASRLDLLSPLEKRGIQDASVAGRIFWLGALVATSELTPGEAAAALARLEERDLVEERATSSVAGEREFAFTHALIREVAYATLPKARRSLNHLRFARWLEQTVGENTDEFLEVLAHHYEQAWRYRFETGDRAPDLARQAIAALRKAGERATALRIFPEARRLCERALSVVQNAGLTDDVALLLELLTNRSEAIKWLASPELSGLLEKDTETVLRQAPQIGRQDLVARAWLNRAFAEYLRGRLEPAEDALRQAFDLFKTLDDRQGQAEALEILGWITEDMRGKLSTAQAAYLSALDPYRAMGDGQGMARTMAWYGRSLIDSGRLEEGRHWLAEALQLARTHHERLSEAYSLAGLAVLEHLAGSSAEAIRLYEEAIAIRQELGDPIWEANMRRHLGMHYLRQGRLDEAERELQTARRLRREHGAKSEASVILRGLAEVYLARGDLLAASDYAEEAYALVREPDEMNRASHAATLARVRAAQGRGEEVEDLFRQSLEILERREYKIDLALTLLKFGEALQWLGQPERARQVLERARGLFAEMGATNFVREVDARLRAAGGTLRPTV